MAENRTSTPCDSAEEAGSARGPDSPVQSRRRLITAGASGLLGMALGALGRPTRSEAAAGSPLIMGSTTNSAGTANTSLTTASSGTALLVTQTGAGTALRGSATAVDGIAGFFTSANGPGVSGVTANKDKYAVYAGHNGASAGTGAALRASGGQNHGVVATTAIGSAYAVSASNPAASGVAVKGSGANVGVMATPPSTSYAVSAAYTYGVVGIVDATTSRGLYGLSTIASGADTFGVKGVSQSVTLYSAGVYGIGSTTSGYSTGVLGESSSPTGRGVFGIVRQTTGRSYAVTGQNDSNDGWAVVAYSTAASGSPYGIYSQVASPSAWCGVFQTSAGNGLSITTPAGKSGLVVTGGSKSAAVETSKGMRLMYSEEATGVYFADYGTGRLANGSAQVAIEPLFAETVNLDEPYHVFVEAYGDAGLYVSNRTRTAFTVRGRDGDKACEFSYRIVGIRKGFEGKRLEPTITVKPQTIPMAKASRESPAID